MNNTHDQPTSYFSNYQVTTNRIIYTPSVFARTNLLHLQECGTLTAVAPHVSGRSGLQSYLFFTVRSGSGKLVYDGVEYNLQQGDCVWIDCQKYYSQCTSDHQDENGQYDALWSLAWVHFYGPNLAPIYAKYIERGGQPVFRASREAPASPNAYEQLLLSIQRTASSESYIRDMELSEQLNRLLTLLMQETVREQNLPSTGIGETQHEFEHSPHSAYLKANVSSVKEYLDLHFTERISLEDLSARFFINKHYLTRVFKAQYGTTISTFVLQLRVTKAKGLLRFSDWTIERIGNECGFESANYFSRVFKKVEGISPREYRELW